jgi:hypothetical protein
MVRGRGRVGLTLGADAEVEVGGELGVGERYGQSSGWVRVRSE